MAGIVTTTSAADRLVSSRRRPAAARWAGRVVFGCCLIAVAWFVVTFLYFPNLSIIRTAFLPDGRSVVDVASELVGSSRVIQAILNTLIVGVISVATVSIVGITQAFLLDALDLRGRWLLTVAYAVPLVFGSVSAVTGYTMVYGPNGLLTKALQLAFPTLPDAWFSGVAAVIVVHTFTMTGYHFLFLRPALRRVDFSIVEAARSLGMHVFPTMVRVVLPVLRPAILASVLMVFIGAVGSFAAPNILGGPHFTMIGPLIQALTGLGRSDMAALLGLVLGIAAVGLLLWVLHEERRARQFAGGKSARPFQRIRIGNPLFRWAAYAVAYALAVVNLAPLLVTAWMSLSPPAALRGGRFGVHLTAQNYVRIFGVSNASQPLVNSLVLCAIAIPLAIVIGTFAAHLVHRVSNQLTDAVQISLFLPYFLPGVLIGLGFLIGFGSPTPLLAGKVLVGTYWVLPLAYIVVLLPTVVRFVRADYAGMDPSLDDAARSLGSRPTRRFFRVTLPLLAPVLIQVAALGFNQTFDEYTVTVMLYNVNNQPLGVTLGTLAATRDPDLVGVTTSYVVINTVIALAVILIADRMAARASRRGIGAPERMGI